MASFMSAGLDAMALAEEDWALGASFIWDLIAEYDAPLLSANLQCEGRTPPKSHVILEQGDLTLGVVGLSVGRVPGCVVDDPAQALSVALDRLPHVDVTIALIPTSRMKAAEIAHSGVDLVLDAEASRRDSDPVIAGSGWTAGGGARGHAVGVWSLHARKGPAGWAPDPTEQHRRAAVRKEEQAKRLMARADEQEDNASSLRKAAKRLQREAREEREAASAVTAVGNLLAFRRVELDEAVGEHASSEALVTAWKKEERQLSKHAQKGTNVRKGARTAPAGSPYAGAAQCVACHEGPTTQWRTTPHAHAWATLVNDVRETDASCVPCHSTGFGQPGGPQTPAEIHGLTDVQCEACHGPGAAHVASAGQRHLPEVTLATCTTCHDGEQDQGRFDATTYWPAVVHGVAEGVMKPGTSGE